MRAGRWEFLEGVRAIGAAEAIARELAKQLAEELRGWPPAVELGDEPQARKFAPLFASGARRPSAAALREGFRLARWEMQHDLEAIDYYLRNDHAGRAAPDPYDRLALEFVWRYLTEALLVVREATEGRVKRRDLLVALDLAERYLLADWR